MGSVGNHHDIKSSPPGRRLRGKIKIYSNVVGAGTIIGEDEKQYLFSKKDWRSEEGPAVDMDVVFKPEWTWARSIVSDI